MVERNGRYAYRLFPDGIREDRALDFHSPYGCSKCAGDQYVLDYARIYGLKTVVFRQSCIYGPRQFGMEDQGWLAWFMIAALTERHITVYGDGRQVRDVLFIEDLLDAYDAAWQNMRIASGKIYNIGGGPWNTLSLVELIKYLERRLGRPIGIRRADRRPGDQQIYISDIGRMRADLGWKPAITLDQGLDELYGWAVQNVGIFNPCEEAMNRLNCSISQGPTVE